MNHLSPVQNESMNKSAMPLVERMDDAVGEATSVMGAVMTELLRRTLRGGVSQIEEGLTAYVGEQVDATIAERTPAIERAAAEIADKTARVAATEIVVDEVRALESRAREADEQLSNRIHETASAAERLSVGAAQLTGRLEQTAQDLTGRLEQTTQSLTGRIEETHKHVEHTTTATAQELTTRIHEAARSAEQRTLDTARDLATQIADAEKRAAEKAQAELAQQVQDLLARSRRTVHALKIRLDTLEARVQETLATVADLIQIDNALATRIAELEKPRGLRRLWRWVKSLGKGGNTRAAKVVAEHAI